ncbi:hypothetical protein BD560DRAFT_399873 [Blakeslea trispora]|nr:hypothetical protein BD560DRAFT_399873 [Blakeslea trispora]
MNTVLSSLLIPLISPVLLPFLSLSLFYPTEWFHGACVGLKPNSVTDHYFCKSCTTLHRRNSATNVRKKSIIILPVIAKSQLPLNADKAPSDSLIQSQSNAIMNIATNEDDEDDDDLCILCDGDCTCGAVTKNPVSLPPTPPPPPPTSPARNHSQKKMSTKISKFILL